jgi:hypothetical protein
LRRKPRTSIQRHDVPGGRVRIDSYGIDGSDGISVWFDRPLVVYNIERTGGGVTVRLIPETPPDRG